MHGMTYSPRIIAVALPPVHRLSRAMLLVPSISADTLLQEALLSFVIPVKMLAFNIQVAELDKNAAGVSLLVVIY